MHPLQLKKFIKNVLREMDDLIQPKAFFYSPEAVQLLIGTACVESDFGYYIEQTNGPALGVFQMEPNTFNDIMLHYVAYNAPILDFMSKKFSDSDATHLRFNLKLAVVMTRLHYHRVSERIPSATPAEQAGYWKRHYNTKNGKGQIEDYLTKLNRFNNEL